MKTIESITIDFIRKIYLSAFLFLCCTLPVNACFSRIGIDDTFPPYYILGLGGFLGLLIAITTKKDESFAGDLAIFTGSYLLFLFYAFPLREIFMAFLCMFFILYLLRVFCNKAQNQVYPLFCLSIPFLFISVFILPPPMAILRCTTGCQSKLKNLGTSLELYYQKNT